VPADISRVPPPDGLRRIAVIGTTGSGKTTMAQRLSERLGIPHVELDALHWGSNWTEVPPEVFRERTDLALRGDTWVADGNYSVVRDMVWGRADTVVWLDYPLWLVMARLWRRTLRRIFTQEELWSGNRERFAAQFFSRESLFLWALQTYGRRRREFPILLGRPEYGHLTVVHLRSPRAAHAWLAGLVTRSAGSAPATAGRPAPR